MGPALAQAKAQHGGNPDRALGLFCQGIIDGLKALTIAEKAEPELDTDYASPND